MKLLGPPLLLWSTQEQEGTRRSDDRRGRRGRAEEEEKKGPTPSQLAEVLEMVQLLLEKGELLFFSPLLDLCSFILAFFAA